MDRARLWLRRSLAHICRYWRWFHTKLRIAFNTLWQLWRFRFHLYIFELSPMLVCSMGFSFFHDPAIHTQQHPSLLGYSVDFSTSTVIFHTRPLNASTELLNSQHKRTSRFGTLSDHLLDVQNHQRSEMVDPQITIRTCS